MATLLLCIEDQIHWGASIVIPIQLELKVIVAQLGINEERFEQWTSMNRIVGTGESKDRMTPPDNSGLFSPGMT